MIAPDEAKILAIHLADFDYNGPFDWWQPWNDGGFKFTGGEVLEGGDKRFVEVEYDVEETVGMLWWKRTVKARHSEWFEWPKDFRYESSDG